MGENQEIREDHEGPLPLSMSDFKGLYDIRDGRVEDVNFILATFLRGIYYGDSWFSLIPKDIFMANYKKVAEALVKTSIIKVACLPDEPDVILGYSMLSPDYLAVHFCFVKSAWRRKGIAKSLVPAHPKTVSHLTRLGKDLLPKLNNPTFNPFF